MLRDGLNIGKSSPGCRKGYLGDEVAHIGQDSPRCQVDFPVSGSDELLVESQVLGGTLASYAQLVQVTAMETDRALRDANSSNSQLVPHAPSIVLVSCCPSLPLPPRSEEGPLRKPKLPTWENPEHTTGSGMQ